MNDSPLDPRDPLAPIGAKVRTAWSDMPSAIVGKVVGYGILNEGPSGVNTEFGAFPVYLVELTTPLIQDDPFRGARVMCLRCDRAVVIE